MKKFGLLIVLLTSSLAFSQVINFDTDANWTAGSGGLTSYQTDHIYSTTVNGFLATFTGGPALRQVAGANQDGFQPTHNGSAYAWRLRDVTGVVWTATISAIYTQGFSFYVRRWDGSPSPAFNVAISSDGGTNWTSVGNIDNAFLGNSSDWVLFSYGNAINASTDIRVRLSSNGTTERIMIDDFDWLGPLPVELTSFSAATIGSTVKLSWNTATEINNYGFEIERASLSASPLPVWEKIGFVNGNGNSNSPKDYSFVDDNVTAGKPAYRTGRYSYRLKQIDNDGQFEYSKTIEVDMNGVKKFELSQNYPNPFNPATTISFNLPEAGNVKLTLFDILGQEIKTLVNEFKESGVHTINFDASELNSGMYIYKIESNGLTQTRKMTLIK